MSVRATLVVVAALLGLAAVAASPATAAAETGPHGSENAIVVVVGDAVVRRGQVVDGVFVVSGDARIAGRVSGDVVVLSGDVVVSGTIEGNLFTAAGKSHLLPSAVVTGNVDYGSDRPDVSLDARVHGDVQEKSWPNLGGVVPVIGGLLFWLASSVSLALLGILALLIAPRAADAISARSRERIGPLIAIGIAIGIVLPVAGVIAAVTVLGLPLAIGIFLSLLPLGAIAYVASAWALGRAIVKPPRERTLSFLAGIAILRALALVPILGLLVDLVVVVFGLGLIGAAIGAARNPAEAEPARSLGS